QWSNSTVAAATQLISALVTGCSKRGGHGTAVRKKSTGKISARIRLLPPNAPKAAIVDITESKQIAHRTISGCHICSREYSRRKTSPPKPKAIKVCAATGSRGKMCAAGGSRFDLQYRRNTNPKAS